MNEQRRRELQHNVGKAGCALKLVAVYRWREVVARSDG